MAEAPRHPTRGARRPFPVVVWVVTGILAVTGVLTAVAWSLNDHTERRLLREQLEQAGTTLTSASSNIEQSLSAAAIAAAAPSITNIAAFSRIAAPLVANDGQFVSMSLWAPGEAEPIAVVGESPVLVKQNAAERRDALAKAGADRLTVVNLLHAKPG